MRNGPHYRVGYSTAGRWPRRVFVPQSEDHGRRTEAHREIAVTDLETCCWKIPRTTEALGTAGLHDAVRLALLRAEPGQVLGSEEEAAS